MDREGVEIASKFLGYEKRLAIRAERHGSRASIARRKKCCGVGNRFEDPGSGEMKSGYVACRSGIDDVHKVAELRDRDRFTASAGDDTEKSQRRTVDPEHGDVSAASVNREKE